MTTTITCTFSSLPLGAYAYRTPFDLNGVIVYPPYYFTPHPYTARGDVLGIANANFGGMPNGLCTWRDVPPAVVDPAILPSDNRWGDGELLFVLNDLTKYITQAVAYNIFYSGNPWTPEVDFIKFKGLTYNPPTWNGGYGNGPETNTQYVTYIPAQPNFLGQYCQAITIESGFSTAFRLASLVLTLENLVPPEPEVPEDTPAVIPRIVACGRGAFATAGCRQMC